MKRSTFFLILLMFCTVARSINAADRLMNVLEIYTQSSDFSVNQSSGHPDYAHSLKEFDIWEHYLKPSAAEWFLISLYCMVFVVSTIGNGLIVGYILRRRRMRSTVNYFMLNLAVTDVLVTFVCLPPTLMVDFLESWLLGEFLCELTPYLQMTVTLVSSLTLGAIAINRWFVVCHPLEASRLSNTSREAAFTIAGIWIFSLATLCPVAFFSKLSKDFDDFEELSMLMSCKESWPNGTWQVIFHTYYVVVGYALPLVVMGVTYSKIFRRLSKNEIPGVSIINQESSRRNRFSTCRCGSIRKKSSLSRAVIRSESTSPSYLATKPDAKPIEEDMAQNNLLSPRISVWRRTSSVAQYIRKRLSLRDTELYVCRTCTSTITLIRMRKKSARMQVALIVVFGSCYAPVMLLDVMRRVFGALSTVHRETIHIVFAIVHLAMYLNSAFNPIIYNFFSAQFRREFRSTFSCFFGSKQRRSGSTFRQSSSRNGIRKEMGVGSYEL